MWAATWCCLISRKMTWPRSSNSLARMAFVRRWTWSCLRATTSVSLRDLERVLPFVDVFLPNDEEAQHLTGEEDPRRQAEAFLRAGCATVVITRGGRGALLMDQTQVIEAPAFDVTLVDSSGAGDAFAGGFIAGMMMGLDQAETLRFASAIGASCCMRLGCTTGIFTREQAEAFLREHPLPLRIDAAIDRRDEWPDARDFSA